MLKIRLLGIALCVAIGHAQDCGPICAMYCENGFVVDEQGCPVCECAAPSGDVNPEGCPPTCRMYCEHGFARDKNGCEICSCAPSNEATSEDCPLTACMMHCQYGFAKDKLGCDMCDCAPAPPIKYQDEDPEQDPCENVSCDEGLACKMFTLTSSKHEVTRCVDPHTPDRCQMPMDAGPCKGAKQMWFYNPDSKQCESFLYGGCEGNANNYDSETKCRLMCIPEIEPDWRICDQMTCYMNCQHGFQKDARGCDVCTCAPAPQPYACEDQDLCSIICNHGLKKDEHGCDICECRDRPPCLEIQCDMTCTYGFARGQDECELCACAQNPCKVIDCPEEQHCVPQQDGELWMPVCISTLEERPWCESRPQCMIHCEHGLQKDQQGCDTCVCWEQEPAECPEVMACGMPPPDCHFGIMFDSTGCPTCSCLPNPCQNASECDKYVACEVVPYPNCKRCPATAKCLHAREVLQVRIRLEYGHDATKEHLHLEDLKMALKDHIAEIMEVDVEDIKGFQITIIHEGAIGVEFYVITFGNDDLVEATEEFEEEINNQELHVRYNDMTFTPHQHTVSHAYSSEHNYPGEEHWGEEKDTSSMYMLIIIIAAVAGCIVGLVVISVVCCAYVRSKNKNKPAKGTGQTYKQVPTNVAQPGEKKQVPDVAVEA